jgi:large subunit ribosomal protein L24
MTQPKLKVKKGDRVVVIAGRDKGKRGEVLSVIPHENRAVVQGINTVQRHQKQTPQQDGGIITKEAPIHISNIAVEDPSDGTPSRVGYKFTDDGRKVRFAKRSGELIDG